MPGKARSKDFDDGPLYKTSGQVIIYVMVIISDDFVQYWCIPRPPQKDVQFKSSYLKPSSKVNEVGLRPQAICPLYPADNSALGMSRQISTSNCQQLFLEPKIINTPKANRTTWEAMKP